MKTIRRMMGPMKSLVFGLVALSVALTAAPAVAYERNEVMRHREEHAERLRRAHERWEREQWEHRNFRYAYRPPYAAAHCFTRPGFWAWDGWQHVWVRPRTVCR
jgi:hypothetical protein